MAFLKSLFEVGNLDVTDSLPNITKEDEVESDQAHVEIHDETISLEREESVVDVISKAGEKAVILSEEHAPIADQAETMTPEEVVEQQQVFQSGIESIAGLLGVSGTYFLNRNGYSDGLNSLTPRISDYKAGVEGLKEFAGKVIVKIKMFIDKIIGWFSKIFQKVVAWVKNYEKKATELHDKIKDMNSTNTQIKKDNKLEPETKIMFLVSTSSEFFFQNHLRNAVSPLLRIESGVVGSFVDSINKTFINKASTYHKKNIKKSTVGGDTTVDVQVDGGSPEDIREYIRELCKDIGVNDSEKIAEFLEDGVENSHRLDAGDLIDVITEQAIFELSKKQLKQEGFMNYIKDSSDDLVPLGFDKEKNKIKCIKSILVNKSDHGDETKSSIFVSKDIDESKIHAKEDSNAVANAIAGLKTQLEYLSKSSKDISDFVKDSYDNIKDLEKEFKKMKFDNPKDELSALKALRNRMSVSRSLANSIYNLPGIYLRICSNMVDNLEKKGDEK